MNCGCKIKGHICIFLNVEGMLGTDKRLKGREENMSKRNKEKKQGQVIKESLIRMQKILEKKRIASSKIELERKTTIEIIGLDKNGRERLIVPQLKEKYGSDKVELSDSFQILMPFISTGTIIINTGSEKHYEEYEVYDITDTKYSLKINDYVEIGKAFTLMLKIDVKSISRVTPIYPYSYECKNVMDFFIVPFGDMIDSYFTQYEKNAIIEPLMADSHEHNIISTIANVIAIFRAMNYMESKPDAFNIYSNEYFKINNWNGKKQEFCFKEMQDSQKQELIKKIMNNTGYSTIIPTGQTEFVIRELIKKNNINKFWIAVGFVFESGLKLLEKEFEKVARTDKSDIEMIIGSLQHFDCKNPGSKIDRASVAKINTMIKNLGVKVYTYQPEFYHGKFYYLQGDNREYVIIGSSNISSTAFRKNYEMDIIYTRVPNLKSEFVGWFMQLRNKSKRIIELDENKFMSSYWESEQNAFVHANRNNITFDNMKNKIDQLTDNDKKFRLNLWMEHRPTEIYENVTVDALQKYFMLVFEVEHIVVFESFIPGNAYYVFKYDEIDELMRNISEMSKTQMKLAEYSVQCGNHISNKENLKKKIDKIFWNGKNEM